MEITLGIDLASQAANTGICVIQWEPGRAEVLVVARGAWDGVPLHDDLLLGCMTGSWPSWEAGPAETGVPVMTAIDAPFGWPDPFIEALTLHQSGRPWPEQIGETKRDRFVRRNTDHVVEQHAKRPLAVSADLIAYAAIRCAILLGELTQTWTSADLARDGSGRVCEAYPDAALRSWLPDAWVGPKPDSYKGADPKAVERREALLTGLLLGLGDGFFISDHQRHACVGSDDALDALVCALLARAVQLRLTLRPEPGEETGLALREGWIHLPDEHSLPQLVDSPLGG